MHVGWLCVVCVELELDRYRWCGCHAKIIPGENCTWRYNFDCEKCTDLAKSVPGSEKGPLAI